MLRCAVLEQLCSQSRMAPPNGRATLRDAAAAFAAGDYAQTISIASDVCARKPVYEASL